ncbi:hypothetical protein GCM10010365_50220 [Streptomyces poonensis]|uniref:Uncharacterized protein n=1 Tax=Streptomyces poonensis TaxID=68255 RepID=A0A918PVY2_9ACTN|nr:hypothetical protein GCM10010365_50220 [Streptomyces poonensis]GLJ89907.1 hypothetical protein GCM10017589_25080 [Streptomyces poonensis]
MHEHDGGQFGIAQLGDAQLDPVRAHPALSYGAAPLPARSPLLFAHSRDPPFADCATCP